MALQVLIESCKTLLANDDFWLAAAVTDQAYEEGTRNREFRKSVEAYEKVGASESLLEVLNRGINGNLTATLNQSPLLTEPAVRNQSRVPDIQFSTATEEAYVECKMLYDCAYSKQFRFKVPEDADKLRDHRAEGRSLFQVVFFVQLPRYTYPSGAWYNGTKRSKTRETWLVYPGIARQYAMLKPCMPQSPTWPDQPPFVRELRLPGGEVDATFLRRWFDFVFTPDTEWSFDAQENLREAAVGCAVWQY